MWFESAAAYAFGPFADERLDFAPGMNVIWGLNEAGKSTWHAALLAGLCGRKRGRGRSSPSEQAFAERHRPWDGGPWEAGVTVRLANGRQVELRHDLDGRSKCTAVDAAVGRDVTGELDLIFDGAPDGARLVGLDRKTFPAIGCVRQADLLGVRDDPGLLSDLLQRAAATSNADATAAAALRRLEGFRHENVGVDQVNAVKPLRRAVERVARARDAAAIAREQHERHLQLAEEVERLEARADDAARALRVYRARRLAERAEAASTRAARAVQLAARFPDGAPPSVAAGASLADNVVEALAAWRSAPLPSPLQGETADELEARLRALPAMPRGDLEPSLEVQQAWAQLRAAEIALESHRANQPSPAEPGALTGARPGKTDAPSGTGGALALAAGGALAVLGAAVFLAGLRVPGLLLVLVGAGALLWQVARSRGAGGARVAVDTAAMAAALSAREAESWRRDESDLAQRRDRAADALRAALSARGEDPSGDLAGALATYQAGCRERAEQARAAAGRGDLERSLDGRRELERAFEEASARRRGASEALRAVAGRCGVPAGSDAEAAAALEAWQRRHAEERQQREQAAGDWAELQALLGGGSPDDLQADAERARAAALSAAEGLSPGEMAALELGSDPDGREAALAGAAQAASEALGVARGKLAESAARAASVAEAEEELAAAQAELERVRELDRILELTHRFLEAAQDRVHRDIAPVLASAVRRRLPLVTAGRYRDARVDPQSLEVRVSTDRGVWRKASLLSHGTAEQVYLLLRVALAERLTKPGEACPLLLDDVTAHADGERTGAILAALHEISRERQVVLFSQEAEVLAWAEQHLSEPLDRLQRLAVAPAR